MKGIKMAQKSKPRTTRKISYRGFEGVDLKKIHSGDESIAFIDNFRITDDGSLKKRYGFKKVYEYISSSEKVKASYSIVENGTEVCYFTQGKKVKKFDFSTETVSHVGTISQADGNIFFFEYLNNLYVCDGEKIFTVASSSLSESTFYIPLYGKDWNAFAGDINEAPNLLWPRVAISYKLTPPSTCYLSLGNLSISSIDALYRNGTLVSPDTYSIHEKYNSIKVNDFADNDVFYAILTFSPDEYYQGQRSALYSSSSTSLFSELNKNNLFFWGNDNTNQIFYTTTVNEETARETDKFATQEGFYVPVDSYFKVASDRDRVKAFIRHYDRTLIMTDTSTWIANLQEIENKSLKLKSINSSIGCVVKNGCVRIENTIFSIGRDAIYEWNADTDELNECNAHSISDPIKDLLCDQFFDNCMIHLNYSKREIWFFNPSQGYTWIYNFTRRVWYAFSGFSPAIFLDGGQEVCFFDGLHLYAFNPTMNYDAYKNKQVNILGKLTSGHLEFNDKRKKKLYSTTVRGEFTSKTLSMKITLDDGFKQSYDISPLKRHSVSSIRTRSGSFTSLVFELTASGTGEQTLHGIELYAD